MIRKKVLILLGSVCLALMMAVMACAAPAPTPTPSPTPSPSPSPTPTPTPTPAQPIVWRFNSCYPSDSITGQGIQHFIDLVKVRSQGRLIIEPYWLGSLGFKSPEGLKILKEGLVEISEVPSCCEVDEPIVAMGSVPFTCKDREEHTYYCEEVFKPVAQKTLDRKGWNCTLFGSFYNPSPMYFFSKQPLRTFDDWQGLSIRTWAGTMAEVLETIGAEPFVIDVLELYTALQRGMISSCVTSYNSAIDLHIYEVLDYVDKLPVWYALELVAVNNDALNSLPEDLQKVFWDSALDYRNFVISANMLDGPRREAILVEGGMEVVIPEEGVLEQMKQKLIDANFYSDWAERVGPEGIEMLQYLGAL